MYGQLSLFDNAPVKKHKPCEYSFHRYVGQKVYTLYGEIKTIAEIELYYTIFTDNTCGTPHDLTPVDPKEYAEMLDVEIEYNEYMAAGKDYTNRSIAMRNLEILKREKELLEI